MRVFKEYEKAYASVSGKMRLIMVVKQSDVWTSGILVDNKGPWLAPTKVRVKTESLLPTPSTNYF